MFWPDQFLAWRVQPCTPCLCHTYFIGTASFMETFANWLCHSRCSFSLDGDLHFDFMKVECSYITKLIVDCFVCTHFPTMQWTGSDMFLPAYSQLNKINQSINPCNLKGGRYTPSSLRLYYSIDSSPIVDWITLTKNILKTCTFFFFLESDRKFQNHFRP